MLEGPLVFVDVDTQRDFLEPSGALFVPGSGAILANLARLTDYARRHGVPVLATACAHLEDDAELEIFPPHCLVGTPGQARVEATAWHGGIVLPSGARHSGDLPPHLTIEKREYSPFSHPEADRLVAEYGRADPTFVVYGVATDYCVKAAVDGLLDRGRRVALVVDAVWPIDAAREADVLTAFVARGACLTLTDVVCGE
jgi:nicotinamidase/pyrazinamidase